MVLSGHEGKCMLASATFSAWNGKYSMSYSSIGCDDDDVLNRRHALCKIPAVRLPASNPSAVLLVLETPNFS